MTLSSCWGMPRTTLDLTVFIDTSIIITAVRYQVKWFITCHPALVSLRLVQSNALGSEKRGARALVSEMPHLQPRRAQYVFNRAIQTLRIWDWPFEWRSVSDRCAQHTFPESLAFTLGRLACIGLLTIYSSRVFANIRLVQSHAHQSYSSYIKVNVWCRSRALL